MFTNMSKMAIKRTKMYHLLIKSQLKARKFLLIAVSEGKSTKQF